MGLLDKLFGPPDIAKLRASGDMKGLLKAAQHKDAAVREQAAAALTSLGAPALEFLVTTLHDSNESQRRKAATLLRKLNWAPRNLPERIAFLIAEEDWAGAAAIGDEALQLIMEYVTNEGRPQEVRTAAVATLGVIGNPACVEAVAQVAGGGSLETACVANLVLGGMGSAAARRMMREIRTEGLTDDQYIGAAQCLGNIGEPAVEPLLEAARELLRKGQEAGSYEILGLRGACFALAATGDRRALTQLRKVYETFPLQQDLFFLLRYQQDLRRTYDTFPFQLDMALLLSVHADPPDSLIICLNHSDPGVRMASAMALGHRKEPSAVVGLTNLLGDQHPPLRMYAAVALGKIGGPAAAQALLERLERVSRDERVYILMALSECREPSAIPRLETYQKPPYDFVHRALATLAIAKIRAAGAVTVGR